MTKGFMTQIKKIFEEFDNQFVYTDKGNKVLSGMPDQAREFLATALIKTLEELKELSYIEDRGGEVVGITDIDIAIDDIRKEAGL